MSKTKRKIRKKNFGKGILIVLLTIVLGVLIYITFIADANLKALGYSYAQISKLKKYGVADQVTTYNQSLVYSLDSREFNEDNIGYYVLFDSQMDLTRILNTLASTYSLDEVKTMKGYMSDEEIQSLIDYDRAENMSVFRAVKSIGYSVADSIALANNLPESSLSSFLSINNMTQPTSYLNYLNSGYDDDTITMLYSKLGDTNFNLLSRMRYFENLHGLFDNDSFRLENLPRYLMALSKGNTTVTAAVGNVNANRDTAYLTKAIAADTSRGALILVNRVHTLDSSYIPSNLTEVDATYRYGVNSLVQEAYDAYRQMADAIKTDTTNELLITSGYVSYASQDIDYAQALIDAENDEAAVDSFMFRAGQDEHQSGYAIDVADKGKETANFAKSDSYRWMQENAYKYGFIQRYLDGKVFLTGMEPQNYHWRYVGVDAANVIHTFNWVLEEYYFLFVGQ